MRTIRRLLLLAATVPALSVLLAGTASAHPLGNFTVNQYSGLQIGTDAVRVDYVIDMAEIPTFQARASIDTNSDGRITPAELAAWAATTCRASTGRLQLRVGGRPAPLRVEGSAATQPPGQAGLPVTRVTCQLQAAVHLRSATAIRYVNSNLADRIGWREITAVGDGATVTTSDVPRTSASKRLRAYPKDLLTSPLDQRSAQLSARPGGDRLTTRQEDGASAILPRGVDALTTRFTEFVGRQHLGLGLGLLAVALALLLGAVHALAPGHGKTVMAAYLVGRNGSLRSALTVGTTVTVTHTAGVLALGVLLSISTTLAPERLFPYLGMLSGVLLAVIGVGLLVNAVRGRSGHSHGPGGHSHGPGGHSDGPSPRPVSRPRPAAQPAMDAVTGSVALLDPDPEHPHSHPHPHEHLHPHPDEQHDPHDHHDHPHGSTKVAPQPSRRNLVAMGFAGGMVPSPSALVVLLGAIALHRTWFGVVLVVCYGLGMAATLTTAGLLLVRARGLLDRPRHSGWPQQLYRFLPFVTASVIVVVGTVIALRALVVALSA